MIAKNTLSYNDNHNLEMYQKKRGESKLTWFANCKAVNWFSSIDVHCWRWCFFVVFICSIIDKNTQTCSTIEINIIIMWTIENENRIKYNNHNLVYKYDYHKMLIYAIYQTVHSHYYTQKSVFNKNNNNHNNQITCLRVTIITRWEKEQFEMCLNRKTKYAQMCIEIVIVDC